jgi:putative flavoprotein involved in K+ transport
LTIESKAGDSTLGFADDLASNLDRADQISEGIKDLIDAHIETNGLQVPAEDRYHPVWRPEDQPEVDRSRLDLAKAGISTVIWATGYQCDYRWVDLPLFNGRGYPTHQRGVTAQPGVYLLGLPWQYTWGSGRLRGVGADAAYLAGRIADAAAEFAVPKQVAR